MALLHNRISHKELREKLQRESIKRVTISFYRYFKIPEPEVFRNEMYKAFRELGVLGRIYIAEEGINAQISLPEENFEAFKQYLYAIPELNGLRLNTAVDDDGKSFFVLKIKVRHKIVADGIEDPNFDVRNTGQYLDVEAYNKLSEQPETIIVDMRNHYEYEVGHFKNAIEIPSDTFREQLPMAKDMLQAHKDKNIIMYCTGGIRCEKATAYMKHNGFKNVFHVEGGIINYARKAKELGLENKFIGKNFVFDERLGEQISDDIISNCHQCGEPCNTHINCKNDGCHLLFIQCEKCAEQYLQCCSEQCRDIVQLPLEEQKKLRAGKENDQKIFNKSKHRLRPRLNEH